jgi:hypothetical protein
MAFDPMREQLIKLAGKLQKDDIKLIIGGGYGLLLKREHLAQTETPTRFELPEARSTNDIDTFLTTEVITDAEKIEKIRDALIDLKFEPVAQFFQFAVSIDDKNPDLKVRIDLLAPPPSTPEERKLVYIKNVRIRPVGASKIHGYLTEEAVTLEENLIPLTVTDEENSIDVFLPHPFTYLVLKLFALRDRLEDEEKGFGAYHSFDIYRIIAMMTEQELEQALTMRDKFADEPKIQEARAIVHELFSSTDSIGVLRLRQHIRSVEIELEDENILGMIDDLKELFPNL